MLSETERKGEIAFLHCAIRAAEKGMVISRPTTQARYDAILDDGKSLIRAQIKYADSAWTAEGVVSIGLGRRKNTHYSDSEVDLLLVYIPRCDGLVALPPKLFCKKQRINVRLTPSKNGQTEGVIFLDEYRW